MLRSLDGLFIFLTGAAELSLRFLELRSTEVLRFPELLPLVTRSVRAGAVLCLAAPRESLFLTVAAGFLPSLDLAAAEPDDALAL